MAEMVTIIFLFGMQSFIPHKEVSIKRKDRTWFNETCREQSELERKRSMSGAQTSPPQMICSQMNEE